MKCFNTKCQTRCNDGWECSHDESKCDDFIPESEQRAASPSIQSAGSVSLRNATSKTLLEYIQEDLKTMSNEQLRKTYKRVRKIVAGLE